MVNFILILLCMAAGMALRQWKIAPPDAHKGINVWLIYVALPAVALKYIPGIAWELPALFPLVSPLVVWLGAFGAMAVLARYKKLSPPTRAALTMTAGMSNTSFVGFPLITAYFGEPYLRIGILCDQATFLLLSTVGLVQAMLSSPAGGHGPVGASVLLKRVFSFPPLLASLAALILPHWVDFQGAMPLFSALAATVSPLALFSVGLQLRVSGWRQEVGLISVALLYKLLLAPALVLAVALLLGQSRSSYAQIGVFEAAMPTLVSSSLLAEQYQLNPRLTNLIIGLSIPISLFSSALWYLIIR